MSSLMSLCGVQYPIVRARFRMTTADASQSECSSSDITISSRYDAMLHHNHASVVPALDQSEHGYAICRDLKTFGSRDREQKNTR
jgi:hypothetical protein